MKFPTASIYTREASLPHSESFLTVFILRIFRNRTPPPRRPGTSSLGRFFIPYQSFKIDPSRDDPLARIDYALREVRIGQNSALYFAGGISVSKGRGRLLILKFSISSIYIKEDGGT